MPFIFLVLALVSFILAAVGWSPEHINLIAVGLALLTFGIIVGGLPPSLFPWHKQA